MIDPPGFTSWQEMQTSQWLHDVRDNMERDRWPSECHRCRDTEQSHQHSVRLASNERHQILHRIDKDYIIVGGVLDNVCNSACQSCNPGLSTKIGSLSGPKYIKIDNSGLLDGIPRDRILEIDINGGEPTASPRYQQLLADLPPNLKILRVNTNGSRQLPNIEKILGSGIKVIVTLSLDGIGSRHDYVRWPIKWKNYVSVVEGYQALRDQHRNLILQTWTTLHALNAVQFFDIQRWCQEQNLDHSWAWLVSPSVLNAHATNEFTTEARDHLIDHPDEQVRALAQQLAVGEHNQQDLASWILAQDQLRKIHIKDYI
jgi:MoaA/NifB/PqqE/SkfB family radical SAM enzyme